MPEPISVVHSQSPEDRMMRLLQMQGGGGGGMRQRPPRAQPALVVAGATGLLGGGCILAGGIVQSVFTPSPIVVTGTSATDFANSFAAINTTSKGSFTAGILYAIGGGLGVVGGGAAIVAGALKR